MILIFFSSYHFILWIEWEGTLVAKGDLTGQDPVPYRFTEEQLGFYALLL